jgi:hypothetical protein
MPVARAATAAHRGRGGISGHGKRTMKSRLTGAPHHESSGHAADHEGQLIAAIRPSTRKS